MHTYAYIHDISNIYFTDEYTTFQREKKRRKFETRLLANVKKQGRKIQRMITQHTFVYR